MTAKESIIHKIISSENRPHLNFSLKHKTEKFTDNLFQTLFDANTCVAKNIEQLEIDFDEIYKLACVVDKESCGTIWKTFLSKLPEILENLNLEESCNMCFGKLRLIQHPCFSLRINIPNLYPHF